MNTNLFIKLSAMKHIRSTWTLVIALVGMMSHKATAQSIIVNMAPIDGIAITPVNILNYQVQSPRSMPVLIKGVIRYRNTGMNLSYSFNCQLREGINTFNLNIVNPQWQFSAPALRELFFTYQVLPEGTYEYCVSILPASTLPENNTNINEECLYQRAVVEH